jgi:hypothetical protein
VRGELLDKVAGPLLRIDLENRDFGGKKGGFEVDGLFENGFLNSVLAGIERGYYDA